MSSGWFTIMGVLVGVFATALVSYVQTLLNHRHERQMKALDFESASANVQRIDRRQSYEKFLTATEAVWQRGNDIFYDVRLGAEADFRRDTRDVIGELMRAKLVLDLVGSQDVRASKEQYVKSLRKFLLAAASGRWENPTSDTRKQLLRAMLVDLYPDQEGALDVLPGVAISSAKPGDADAEPSNPERPQHSGPQTEPS